MKRVSITYDSMPYSLPKTTAAAVKETIERGLEGGKPFWLTVNAGEGAPQPVELLFTPGIAVAVADVGEVDLEESGRSSEFPGMASTTADLSDFPYED